MSAFLSWSILILAVAGFVVWVYQAIIIPTERQRIRFRLFELRDRLRQLVIDGKLKEDSAAFILLHDRLNIFIRYAPSLDFGAVLRMERIPRARKQEIDRRIAHIHEQIEASIPEVREIYHEGLVTAAGALILNSALLIVWTLPTMKGIWHIREAVKKRYEPRVEPIFGMRERDFAAIV